MLDQVIFDTNVVPLEGAAITGETIVALAMVRMPDDEPDSTVDAAVLCEYGSFDPYKLSFSYMVRYKIFSKEGLNSLIMSIPVQSTNTSIRL